MCVCHTAIKPDVNWLVSLWHEVRFVYRLLLDFFNLTRSLVKVVKLNPFEITNLNVDIPILFLNLRMQVLVVCSSYL